MDTKAQATEKAKELLGKMKTKGWKIRVWENLGWHHSVMNYGIEVYGPSYPSEEGKYSCFLHDKKRGAGSPSYWHDAKSYKDPNVAVERQIAKARKFIEGIDKHLNAVVKALSK